MPQTNVVFHCWFEDKRKDDPLDGLYKFCEDFESGLEHFKNLGAPLVSDEYHYEFKWVDTGIFSTQNYVSFELICPHTETPFVKDLIKQFGSLSVKYMLLDVDFSGGNDVDISFGIDRGKQVNIKELIAVSSEDAPIFALIVSILKPEYFSAKIVNKIVTKEVDTIIYVKNSIEDSKPILFYLLEESAPIEMLDVFLKAGGSPDALYSKEDLNPIHYAASIADIQYQEAMMDKIDVLIKYKCNIDEVTADKKTPLMYAIEHGRYKLAEFIIASGADLNWKDKDGLTALNHAERLNNQDLIKRIKKAEITALKKPKTKLDKLTENCRALINECNLADSDFEKMKIILKNRDILGVYVDGDDFSGPCIKEKVQTKIKMSLPDLDDFVSPEDGLYEFFRALSEILKDNKYFLRTVIEGEEIHIDTILKYIGVEGFQV